MKVSGSSEALAIVGVGCRVHGASGPEELWSLLRRSQDVVAPTPERGWGDFYDADPFAKGKSVSRFGSFLEDVAGVDWRFFGLSPREARSIDPQHRLLLEVAWETLEDAGMPISRAAGSRAGVFVGIMINDYGRFYSRDPRAIDGYTTQNNTFAYAANRISFYFDLHGPSVAVDTNCSGSLLAFHQACRSVATGEADWALAGGVSLILTPDVDISMSKAAALSPTGRIRTWDAKADGFVRGEGAGLVLVKPLTRALAERDRIYALVLGTAANHKGHGNWISEPSSEAQRDAILTACAIAGIEPEAMDYVELHGTGTPKGDPAEAAALGAVMAARPADRPCRVGSIKTNIGHLDAAAGVLGLIKTALCVRHRELVPSLHFESVNPAIDLDRLKLSVQTAVEPWPRRDAPATAGVTSIGFGGTNVHAILRENEAFAAAVVPQEPSYVLPLSARSEGALSSLASRLAEWLEGGGVRCPALGDLAHTLAVRRTHHDLRLAVTGDSPEVLSSRLRDFVRGSRGAVAVGTRQGPTAPRVVFVFPGHGPQWLGMALDLVSSDSVFARAITACDDLVSRETGWSVIDMLLAAPGASRLEEPEVVQPVLFSIQIALAALWRAWGIVPDVVVGHSFGEIAAAVVSGALALENGVRIVCARGRLTQRRAGRGGVAVVDLPRSTVETMLGAYPTLEVGGENSPATTIVSGGLEELEVLLRILAERNVFARRVKLGYASHSRDMDVLLDDFAAAIDPIATEPMRARFCSTVLGRLVEGALLGPDYWVRNLRAPVRFADAVRAVGGSEPSVFLEISPHPVLTAAVRQNLEGSGVLAVLPSLQRGKASLAVLDDSLGRLYAAGCDPDWAGRYPHGTVVSTPTYAWQHERMWIDIGTPELAQASRKREHPLLGVRVESSDPRTLVWEQTIGGPETAYFRDHLLQGVPSGSTSAMVEMMVAAASRTLGTEALELLDIQLRRALILPREGTYRVQTLLTRGAEWAAEVRGRADSPDSPWRTHATANVRLAADEPEAPRFDQPLVNRLSRDEAYRELGSRGLQYGPTFQGVEWLSREGEGVLACVSMPDGLDPQPYFFHPAMHDAAMHVCVLAEACRGHSGVLPIRIGRIWIRSRPTAVLRTHARVRQIGTRIRGDLRVETFDGGLVEIIEGIELAHLDDAIVASDIAAEEASWLYNVQWAQLGRSDASSPSLRVSEGAADPGCWLILADRQGVGAALAERIRAAARNAVVVTADAFEENRRTSGDRERGPRDLVRAITSSVPPGEPIAGIVHLWSLDLPDVEAIEPDRIDAAILASCDSALRLLGALDQALPTTPTPVWFVTRGAQPWALRASKMAPLGAPLWGLARAMAAELPSRWGGLVDLDPEVALDHSAAQLWSWLTATRNGEDEVLFRHGETYASRLVRRPVEQDRHPLEFRQDASYLVTGGTGGLGLAVARWLATRGAQNLVLAARTLLPPREAWTMLPQGSPFSEQIEAILAIEKLGATAHLVSLDVADHAAVIEFINDHERKGRPPIRGVFHLAGIVRIEDALRLDAEELVKTLRPKVHGTLALHRWLEDLDFFILFSSASSVIRSPRLGHYAAGNAFLDAMAHYRRARGQSAISIDWGLWSDIGFIRQLGDRGPDAMTAMKSIPPDSGIRILERLAENGDVQAVVWPPDWEHWARTYPTFARTSLIAHLLGPSDGRRVEPPRTTLPSVWSEVPEADRAQALRDLVTREIAGQLRMPVEDLPQDTPLERLGFDSLLATELQARFIADLAVQIPILRLLGFATARTIADEVAAGVRDSDRRLKAAVSVSEGPSQGESAAPAFRRSGS